MALYGSSHGLINYTDTKAKFCHLKKFTCKERLCGRCLSEFIGWRYSQSCWYFQPSFVNCRPSNLLSGSTLPPAPPLFCKVQYVQRVCGWEGVGVLETIFCRSLAFCILPDSEPTKLLNRPKQKPRRGGDLRQINTCRKVPLKVNRFRWHIFL